MDLLDTRIYSAIGEEGFTRLVAAFYKRVPADDILGPMYPQSDLAGAEDRLRGFLIQRFGGPQTYSEKRGHPRLRMRHGPFHIDQRARDRWIELMEQALAEVKLPADVETLLRGFFHDTATFMINRALAGRDEAAAGSVSKARPCGPGPFSPVQKKVPAHRAGALRKKLQEIPHMKIAVMPGDFVGKEVVAEGLKVLKVASQKFGFKYDTTDYPFGAEHYLKTKITLPDSALKELAAHDAILFGAVGADPRGNAQIPQGLIETDILLKILL